MVKKEKKKISLEDIGDSLQNINERFVKIDSRFDSLDKRFNDIDKRLDAIDKHIDGLDKTVETLVTRVDNLDRSYRFIAIQMEKLEGKFDLALEGYGLLKELGEKMNDRLNALEGHA